MELELDLDLEMELERQLLRGSVQRQAESREKKLQYLWASVEKKNRKFRSIFWQPCFLPGRSEVKMCT